jgi:hypothetical protein
MRETDPAGATWTATEIDLIVADYFAMLRMEMLGKPYVKAHHNSELQRLTGRSKGSIEYKHQNVSAVLDLLGLPWILGYKPAVNFQKTLIDGIDRHLLAEGQSFQADFSTVDSALAESETLFFESPPILDTSHFAENKDIKRLVRKFDPAERDSRNRTLGEKGERKVLSFERARLTRSGRPDLASDVEWTSKERGDGAGYDIRSFTASGEERFLEVKTTSGYRNTPFFITENERSFSDERPDAFRIIRLYDFHRTPRAFELKPPLNSAVILKPTTYRASFSS